MSRFPDPTIFIAACSNRHQLARQVKFLREENRILRARLPDRISTTPEERRRLLRFGIPLGDAINGLISIVKPETFAKWVRRGPGHRRCGKTGRPRKPEEIRALIVRIARETGWGSTRVLGELRKLGINSVCRTTVRRILQEHGIDPAPKRRGESWDEFIRAHAETLWACDFFTKTVLTPLGPRLAFVLFFLHIKSRRVIVSEPTLNPTREWTAEQAALFLTEAAAAGHSPPGLLLRDRDGKFGPAFDRVLEDSGCRANPLPPRSSILNAFAERWVQSAKWECLDHFIVFGLGHLACLLNSWVPHYHEARPHQGLDKRLIAGPDSPETLVGPIRAGHGSAGCSGATSGSPRSSRNPGVLTSKPEDRVLAPAVEGIKPLFSLWPRSIRSHQNDGDRTLDSAHVAEVPRGNSHSVRTVHHEAEPTPGAVRHRARGGMYLSPQ